MKKGYFLSAIVPLIILSGFFLTACNDDNSTISLTPTEKRSFRMGFTTWKYAADQASQTDIYQKVRSPAYGDIVALHYLDGIPWDLGNDSLYPPQDLLFQPCRV